MPCISMGSETPVLPVNALSIKLDGITPFISPMLSESRVGPGLRPAVSDRWLSRVHDGVADALWALGAAPTTPRRRPHAHAALDTAAAAALCAGDQDRTPATFGP